MERGNLLRREFRMIVMRNFVFGVEDSLVSTVGLLSGIAAVGTARETVILTGVVLIFVEAFSMAVGSFLSEHSAEEYAEGRHEGSSERNSRFAGFIMFASYFTSGFIPLAPYLIFEGMGAVAASVAVSLAALFGLGAAAARAAGVRVLREALRMLLVGGTAVAVGVAVGTMVHRG